MKIDIIKKINPNIFLLSIVAVCLLFMCFTLLSISNNITKIRRDVLDVEFQVSRMNANLTNIESDVSNIETTILLKFFK